MTKTEKKIDGLLAPLGFKYTGPTAFWNMPVWSKGAGRKLIRISYNVGFGGELTIYRGTDAFDFRLSDEKPEFFEEDWEPIMAKLKKLL